MGVNTRYQVRWIVNTAVICIFASSILLLVLQAVLDRALGHDYHKAYYILKELDSSFLMQISAPILVYILVASLLVVFFKLLISHKIAGPVYRFERCAASMEDGDFNFSTRLRAGDQLNGLAETFGELKYFLDRPLRSAEGSLQRVESLLQEAEGTGDMQAADRQLREIEAELARLAKSLRP